MKTPDEIKKGLECCTVPLCAECPYDSDPSCVVKNEDALAYIKQLEAKVPKWISVKQRLPEPYEAVIVYARHTPKQFSNWSAVMEDIWLGDGWECNADTEVHEVTHWMPLPEPPEGV